MGSRLWGTGALALVVMLVSAFVSGAAAWKEWKWRIPEGTTADVSLDLNSVQATGSAGDSLFGMAGRVDPGPRRGHTWELFEGSVFLFGGRSNDIVVPHTPRTYEIVTVNGSLVFKSYDQKLVNPACNITDPDCPTLQQIGLYYNDVWEYPINCTRWEDFGCQYEGWKVLNAGSVLGGCRILENVEHCSHPTERFDHMSTIFSDGTLLVYGGFSHRCEDYCSDMWTFNVKACKEVGRDEASPGRECQWTQIGEIGATFGTPQKRWRSAVVAIGDTWWLFGGQRMWHGFGVSNSVENRWDDLSTLPSGGYMQDLWRYDKEADEWEETDILESQSCFADPGETWEERNDVTCVIYWPDARAGGRMLFYDNALLLHGGYRTFFPYPHSNARGAGSGTAALSSDGFSPYPTYPFYLDDMWRYNFTIERWAEVIPIGNRKPAARVAHTLVLASDVLYLFGGYRSNYYFGDLWMYNISTNRWLEKPSHVHALWPENCTDDTVIINGIEAVRKIFDDQGNAIGEFASVYGEPTRGHELDLEFGRTGEPLFIKQPRRQAPGWDGCRDRADGRADLPAALMYEQPLQRAGHQAIFTEDFRLMLVYGGRALLAEQAFGLKQTHPSAVRGDLWQMHIDHCPKNCSNHGDCYHGYCYCKNGYYGVDCSNTSCPGDFCWYDTAEHKQHCRHCCHAPHPHQDAQLFIEDQRKVPCDHDHIGESHGICDGFGNCQCRPPYLGRDCAIRDCPNNCTFNGWCDVQYPISRCMCDPGWIGTDCSELICLNNCSYPNGVCVDGTCECEMTYNPYNRTVEWKAFAGEDCSYVTAFAAAADVSPGYLLAAAGALAAAALSEWASASASGGSGGGGRGPRLRGGRARRRGRR